MKISRKIFINYLFAILAMYVIPAISMDIQKPKITVDYTLPAELWEQILDYAPNDAFLNELSRKIELSPQAYDKIIERYIQRALDFYPLESEIKAIVDKDFQTTHAQSLSPETFQKNIYNAFERFLGNNNFGNYKCLIDSNYNLAFQDKFLEQLEEINNFVNFSEDKLNRKLAKLSKEKISSLLKKIRSYENFICKTLSYLNKQKPTRIKIDKAISQGSLDTAIISRKLTNITSMTLGQRNFRITYAVSLSLALVTRFFLLYNSGAIINALPNKILPFISLTPDNSLINRLILKILPKPEIVDPLWRGLFGTLTFFNLPNLYSILGFSAQAIHNYHTNYNLHGLERFLLEFKNKLQSLNSKIANYAVTNGHW